MQHRNAREKALQSEQCLRALLIARAAPVPECLEDLIEDLGYWRKKARSYEKVLGTVFSNGSAAVPERPEDLIEDSTFWTEQDRAFVHCRIQILKTSPSRSPPPNSQNNAFVPPMLASGPKQASSRKLVQNWMEAGTPSGVPTVHPRRTTSSPVNDEEKAKHKGQGGLRTSKEIKPRMPSRSKSAARSQGVTKSWSRRDGRWTRSMSKRILEELRKG